VRLLGKGNRLGRRKIATTVIVSLIHAGLSELGEGKGAGVMQLD
jgi:hypothetical protein